MQMQNHYLGPIKPDFGLVKARLLKDYVETVSITRRPFAPFQKDAL
jgi:hypothetical protein